MDQRIDRQGGWVGMIVILIAIRSSRGSRRTR